MPVQTDVASASVTSPNKKTCQQAAADTRINLIYAMLSSLENYSESSLLSTAQKRSTHCQGIGAAKEGGEGAFRKTCEALGFIKAHTNRIVNLVRAHFIGQAKH